MRHFRSLLHGESKDINRLPTMGWIKSYFWILLLPFMVIMMISFLQHQKLADYAKSPVPSMQASEWVAKTSSLGEDAFVVTCSREYRPHFKDVLCTVTEKGKPPFNLSCSDEGGCVLDSGNKVIIIDETRHPSTSPLFSN